MVFFDILAARPRVRTCGTGHYEMPPYSNDTMRSVYHVREFEVFKLKQVPLLLLVLSCTV